MPVVIAAAALLGLAIGSFLNVVIYRVPQEMSLSHPSSRCPACGHPIRNRHNVPLVSWLILRGRCADCSARISVRYPLVELATSVLFVAMTLQMARLHILPALPAFLFFAAIGIALTLIDVDLHRLPNAIVLPSYPILALMLTIAALAQDEPARLVRAAICGMALFLLYFVMAFAYPAGMGLGDVKLAGIVGAMLGFLSYQSALVGAFAAFLTGGLVGMLVIASRRGSRKSHLPFGPFMILAALLAVFAGNPIAELYSRLLLNT
jgi:leader peptidase (prepilin peptidase)/N-methyltransferase